MEDSAEPEEQRPQKLVAPWIQFKDYIKNSAVYYQRNPGQVKSEILSGITISILKVPESVAFSYVAGVHPLQGLYGSFFMGIITGFLGGRPGMISGCAGALAVVIKDIMDDDGPFPDECPDKRREYLFFTMILTGILQLVCGVCRCAALVRLIPKTAFLGFFNGLAVVIFMSQLQTFKKAGASQETSMANCTSVDYGFKKDQEWYQVDERTTWLMLIHVFVVMFIMEALPRIPAIPLGKKPEDGAEDARFKLVVARLLPPSLVGLLLTMAIEWFIFRHNGWDTPVVKDVSRIKGQLPPWHIPDVPWDEWDTWRKCLPTAASLCAIGLVESVLTLQAVDQILDQTTEVPAKNQECLAQGLANLASGFFKAMGGDAMIGQSTINVLNGAKGRLSAITDACFLMIYIVYLSNFIESVPTAGLAGVLFIVVIHTFNWPSIAIILRRALPLYMCATIVIVTVLSVVTNLAVGIGVGILWECVFYVWHEGAELNVQMLKDKQQKTYRVAGNVFFANADDFNSFFTPTKDPESVIADLANARLLDYSALFTLNALGRRYELAGRQFKIEMKPDDFERYMAVCDEGLRGAMRCLPTRATKSIEGKVSMRELQDFKFQEFLLDGPPAAMVTEHAPTVLSSHSGLERRTSTHSNSDGRLERRPSKNAWAPVKAPFEKGFSDRTPSKQSIEQVSPKREQVPGTLQAAGTTAMSPTRLAANAGQEVPLPPEITVTAPEKQEKPFAAMRSALVDPAAFVNSPPADRENREKPMAAMRSALVEDLGIDAATPDAQPQSKETLDPEDARPHPLSVPTSPEEPPESPHPYLERRDTPEGLDREGSEEWV